MRWSNDLVEFIINKIQGHDIRVYFYTVKDDILLVNMATEIDKNVIVILREEIVIYLRQTGYNFILKVSSHNLSSHNSELRVEIKDGVLSG